MICIFVPCTFCIKCLQSFNQPSMTEKLLTGMLNIRTFFQGPSASAYVTYIKSDDALKAILAVNNVHIDGRTLKASLGTTKYCSHFLRGTQCPKTVSETFS